MQTAKEYLSNKGYTIFEKDKLKDLESLGCVLSDKEKAYLKENNILEIGDLIGKRISDNKLVCFEVMSEYKDYWVSNIKRFEENCKARKSEIEVFYVFNNLTEKKIEIVDIKDLWFNLHLNSPDKNNPVIDIIPKKIFIEKKSKYYSNLFILFEIVKCLKNREMCMLQPKQDYQKRNVRYLLAFSVDYLKKHFERFDFNEGLSNLYNSVALLTPNVPVFSYNLKERRKDEAYQDFNKNYKNYVQGYDLFIDFDADWDWEKAHKDALEVKKIFDEYKLPYYLMNSSFKGFHFHIPAEYMPNKDILELLDEINEAIYNLKGIYGLETIDTSIFDMKRVCKVPYSFVSDGSVCLPLDDSQFQNFKPEMVKMENVLYNTHLKNRGLLTRTHGLTDDKLKENFMKFLEEFK